MSGVTPGGASLHPSDVTLSTSSCFCVALPGSTECSSAQPVLHFRPSLYQALHLCPVLQRDLGLKRKLQRGLVTSSRSHSLEERAEPGQQSRSQLCGLTTLPRLSVLSQLLGTTQATGAGLWGKGMTLVLHSGRVPFCPGCSVTPAFGQLFFQSFHFCLFSCSQVGVGVCSI